jgi:hypothetical protein
VIFSAISIDLDLQPKLYAVKEIRWFFNMEYLYFLMILLPATYIGDVVHKRNSVNGEDEFLKQSGKASWHYYTVLVLMLLYIIWLMVALYKGMFVQNLVVSVLIPVIVYFLSSRSVPWYNNQLQLATLLSVSGAMAVLLEGSVSKSPCTIGYCLTTAAISVYFLMLLDFIVLKSKGSFFVRIFSGAGANPLMSYVTFGSFLMPLFKITGLVYIYNAAYPAGYPWIGVIRAALVVLLTMAIVARASENKIFWRA